MVCQRREQHVRASELRRGENASVGSAYRIQAFAAGPAGFFLILLAITDVTTARERNTGIARYAAEDPNSRFVCEGTLAEYAACQCNEDDGEVACINAQFVDTNVFMTLPSFYRYLKKITFHGNNFQDLPTGSLFGASSAYSGLDTLNISANYIVNLNSNALEGLRSLRVLDLSNNEIVLKDADLAFLTHTPFLEELFLRRAFTSTINRTVQFDYMMRMFERAKLEKLQVLDLSYNFFSSLPYDLACPFPSLTRLDLRQNFLKTFAVNASCLTGLRTIDLSRNQIHQLSPSFRLLAGQLQPQSLVLRNAFHCDCNAVDYITWLRSTNVVREKSSLICERASPRELAGARVAEVPVSQLDCSVDLFGPSIAAGRSLSVAVMAAVVWMAQLI